MSGRSRRMEQRGRVPFYPGCMGSRAYVDPASLSAMLSARDLDGVSVEAALRLHDEALADFPRRPLGAPFKAFLEAHIEQGPVLEREGKAVAAVNAIQGRRVYEIVVAGRTDHAGTTPYAARSDALEYATSLLQRALCTRGGRACHPITSGRIDRRAELAKRSGRVHLTVDIRHPDERTLQDVPAWLSSLRAAQAGSPAVAITEIDRMDPQLSTPVLSRPAVWRAPPSADSIHRWFPALRTTRMRWREFCPTAMIFVRCRGGVSHHEDEYASSEDLAAGARALSPACSMHAASHRSRNQCRRHMTPGLATSHAPSPAAPNIVIDEPSLRELAMAACGNAGIPLAHARLQVDLLMEAELRGRPRMA